MKQVFVMSAVILLCAMATGCGKQGSVKVDSAEPAAVQIVKIGNILKTPDSYTNSVVAIEGKIVRECPSGCWFDLQEGGAMIHVDIKPSGLAIPQKVGKTALVEGRVSIQDNNVEIIGTKVDFK